MNRPALYLKGVSTSAFPEALQAILGEGVIGLSANNRARCCPGGLGLMGVMSWFQNLWLQGRKSASRLTLEDLFGDDAGLAQVPLKLFRGPGTRPRPGRGPSAVSAAG